MINLYTFIFIYISPAFVSSSSNQFFYKCVINNELEDGMPSQNKIYKNKSLNLYLDKNNNWLNDMPFNQKLISKKNIIYSLRETEVNYTSLKKNYYTTEKKELESKDSIRLNKINGKMSFIKFYYDINQKVFFSSEISGICTRIVKF